MHLFTALILLLTLAGRATAADFLDAFEALEKSGDPAAIEAFLERASVSEAENPEYYATAGNYWWGVAGAVSVTPVPAGDYEVDPKDFSIRDPETGKVVGSITEAGKADPGIRKRALELLVEGARRFPARADIALGLAHVQQEMGMREGFVNTLAALLAEAGKDAASLKWKKDEPLPEPAETFLPETVQTYSAALFNADTPATDALCARLLAAVVKAFPEHPYAYNLQGALADAQGKPDEALRCLEIAHRKDPKDPLILSNLAGARTKAGRTDEAAAAYRAILALDEAEPAAKAAAKKALEALDGGLDAEAPEAKDDPPAEPE